MPKTTITTSNNLLIISAWFKPFIDSLSRLREMELNFVFLRAGAVRGTAPEQKTENAKIGLRIVKPILMLLGRCI
ncbi:MAG: hypothetical protein ACI4IK_05885 [Eubacterium sp.]